MLESLHFLVNFILHIDDHLKVIISNYGNQTYFILWLIIFCETGLVILPFLPGDSLLFAAGAIVPESDLNIITLILILLVAAILGDAINYKIGNFLGTKVYTFKDNFFFKQKYLTKTQEFYNKYGGKTIIIARFVPIVRTFAPFLAGVGKMEYRTFAFYNIIGAILWVCSLTLAGYFFGGLDIVKDNFGLVIIAIIIISILPAVVEIIKAKLGK